MDGLNYMPADGTRAAIKNRGLRHHPDSSSSKNYSVSEGRTGGLFDQEVHLWCATVDEDGHYATPDVRQVPDFARSSGYPRPRRVSPCNCEPFRRAVPHYPGGSRGCACRSLPHACDLPQMTGRSASAFELSRPARASLCYGPSDRSPAQGRLRRRAPTQPVPGRAACQLPDQSTIIRLRSSSLIVRALGAHDQSRRLLLQPGCARAVCLNHA